MYVFLGHNTQLDEERQGHDECTSKNILGRATFPPFTTRRNEARKLHMSFAATNYGNQHIRTVVSHSRCRGGIEVVIVAISDDLVLPSEINEESS